MAESNSPVSTVAERYATALYELASDEGALGPVEADLNRFAALVDESEDLRRLVRSPVFAAEDQERAIAAVLDNPEAALMMANAA
ncbi:MAG TPA: F0F1 ATP synthase subunit delta, partial [Bauldia sp.]|nr:F0F1 ATP synthase subunit delta [Bauldia sp.]